MDNTWLYISIIASVISIGVAVFLYFWVKRQDPGTEKAQEVASVGFVKGRKPTSSDFISLFRSLPSF